MRRRRDDGRPAIALNYAQCQSCRAQVVWTTTAKTGSAMPLDRDDVRGNVVLDGHGRAHVFKDHAAALRAIDALPALELDGSGCTFISHHAEGQCPQGPEWRGKRRGIATPIQEELEV